MKQQVQELRIEVDKARQAHLVSQITGTDYFQQLRRKANNHWGILDQETDEE